MINFGQESARAKHQTIDALVLSQYSSPILGSKSMANQWPSACMLKTTNLKSEDSRSRRANLIAIKNLYYVYENGRYIVIG